MVRPSVFFADVREVCIALFNSHTTPARMNNIQKLLEDNMKQATDPENSFNIPTLIQSKLQTMQFRNKFHAISGLYVKDKSSAHKCAVDNGSCDSKYAETRPDLQKNMGRLD